MKTISKLALAALLATSAGGLVTVPAIAKDKKEEAKKPGLKLSPDVLKAAQAAQPAIAAKDFATAEPALAQIDAAAKTDDDKYIGAALRYDFEQQKLAAAQAANPNAPINETAMAAPLDVLIANPSTPAEMRGKYAYRRGALAFNGKQYAQALTYFDQAKKFGYNDPNLGLQIVKAKMESGDVAGGTQALDAEIAAMTAAGQKAPEEYYRYAISKANARKDGALTMTWLGKYVQAYPTAKNWRDVLVTYGLQQNSIATLDKTQKLDLFRLMRASKSLSDQYDYQEYAQAARDKGLPAETKAVLQEGIAAGKVPATNTNVKESLADATAAAKAEGSLAGLETRSKAAADGKLAAATGDGYLSQDNWAKAAELYKVAIQKGVPNADEVNTHLGIALARSGDKAGAQAAFAAVKTEPRAGIASLWTSWMNTPPTA